MNSLDPWFITGFVEGEGAFTYINGSMPVFSIRQRHDYGDLVQAVADFFKVGTVYPCRAWAKSQANAYYRVSRLHDLEAIIRHFDTYPLVSAKKQAAYAAWKDLVFFKRLGRTTVKRMKNKQGELTARLTSLNCRGRPRKPKERNDLWQSTTHSNSELDAR